MTKTYSWSIPINPIYCQKRLHDGPLRCTLKNEHKFGCVFVSSSKEDERVEDQ